MTYPTAVHQWIARYGLDPATVRRGQWFARLGAGVGSVDSPAAWADRIASWAQVAVLSVGENGGRAIEVPDSEAAAGREPEWSLPSQDQVALVVRSWDGSCWAYSHRAVWSAGLAVAAFGVRRVWGAPPAITWWDHWPWLSQGSEFVPTQSSMAGLVAFSDGPRIVYWHPRVLGPVLLEVSGERSWAPELSGMIAPESSTIRFRGEAVPLGRWTGTDYVPLSYPGGWWQ